MAFDADAEPQRQRADRHEARTAAKASDAMSSVLPETLQPWVTPERASILPGERHVAHRGAHRVRRFVLGDTRAMEITLCISR
jgi:hypothetical protein